MYGNPAECEKRGDRCAGYQHVEWACLIREEIWDHTTEDRSCVEDDEEVEGEVFVDVGARRLGRVGLNVKEWDVKTHEAEELAEGEECVWHLFKGRELEEFAFLSGLDSDFHHGE